MSEGERVETERLRDRIQEVVHYVMGNLGLTGDICGKHPTEYINGLATEVIDRLVVEFSKPDPVPALQARIAELEGIFRNLSLLVSDGKGFEVEAHPDGATILLTEHDGATTYEMETQRSVFDALAWAADFAASTEPTPAAAKEQ